MRLHKLTVGDEPLIRATTNCHSEATPSVAHHSSPVRFKTRVTCWVTRPSAALTYCALAQVLAQRGRLAEAEHAARTAARLDPKFASAGKLLEPIARDLWRRANVARER